jgi:hypothetical protein
VKSKTVDYSQELYADVMDHMVDYHQTGWTVCGAEDPAVITIRNLPADKYPELTSYGIVRVIDRYMGPNKSETLLVFSHEAITPDEYAAYEEVIAE